MSAGPDKQFFQTIDLFSVIVKNILSYGLLGYMFQSLFTQHKVAKGQISTMALQKGKLNLDEVPLQDLGFHRACYQDYTQKTYCKINFKQK